MKPIALFYHCLFYMGDPPELRINAFDIVSQQMDQLKTSGLLDVAREFYVGINGPEKESFDVAILAIPSKAKAVFHGRNSFAENMTIVTLHKFTQDHPGWNILYFHAKGCSHLPDSDYGNNVSRPWRHAMMQDLVMGWRECVAALDAGYEVCCSHFMRGMADGTQNIAAGNFWWATSSFLAKLPSMFERERIKVSGIAALESRYEAEVWIGNGSRLPRVKEYRPNGGGGVP